MKINKANLTVTICCLGTLAATSIGQAGLTQLSISAYKNYTFDVSVQSVARPGVIASAFAATRTGGDLLPLSHPNPFTTFCLDIDYAVANGYWLSGNFSDVALTSDSGAIRQGIASLQYVAELYATYAPGVPAGGWTSAQKLTGSALQLAIWEVLYEYPVTGGFSLSTGTGFTAAGNTASEYSIIATANSMLASLTFGSPNVNVDSTFWNATTSTGRSRNSQDLIGPYSPPITAVPEPATMIAGALLLLPFGVSTLRILRKNRGA